ncbi:unnamed protein product [Mytilus edulis]|uniref:EGF-like domain-containing protein n=1 Tax=Mytilus edulis TaxID=6550 RepID=A0A8S3TKJ8_MYTED|nr:unnamed protein product [Mytilus edulis]
MKLYPILPLALGAFDFMIYSPIKNLELCPPSALSFGALEFHDLLTNPGIIGLFGALDFMIYHQSKEREAASRLPLAYVVECPAGKWGQHCALECLQNYHGVQCKHICNCLDGKKCDPVHGCICDIGFNGPQCSNVCPYGSYGVQCSKECSCAHDADCDPVSGVCVCRAGWFGNHCTQACSNGTYGTNCTAECMCSKDAQCDHVTGECVCPAGRFGYNCTKQMPKNSKPNIERRKAKRRLSSAPTQDAHTGSSFIDTETSLFHNPMDEGLYCEIGDIDDLKQIMEMNKN